METGSDPGEGVEMGLGLIAVPEEGVYFCILSCFEDGVVSAAVAVAP
jgi:hypothetical protein